MRRILSIDGGGIKGVFPAAFLAGVEESLGEPIGEYFDLIVGTSTGGIIAIGLGLGLSAHDILAFYETHGPKIFSGNRRVKGLLQLGRAKYRREPLEAALRQVFGDRRLGESRTRLVVPSLNLETGEVHVYKTSHHPRLEKDYKLEAVEAALATAAAPTYFPTFRAANGIPLVDGGMWANNPVGPAVVEALGVLEWPRDELKVLSLGCTTEPLRAKPSKTKRLGLNYWALKVATVFMAGQSSASLGTAQLLAGHANVIRISPAVPNKRFKLDSVKDIESLKGLGASEARRAMPDMRKLLTHKATPFVPAHALNNATTAAGESAR